MLIKSKICLNMTYQLEEIIREFGYFRFLLAKRKTRNFSFDGRNVLKETEFGSNLWFGFFEVYLEISNSW